MFLVKLDFKEYQKNMRKGISKEVIKNIEDFSRFNAIYSKFFDKDFPARSAVGVAGLPKNVLIEIEVIAEVKS